MRLRSVFAIGFSVLLAACGAGKGCDAGTPESDLPTVSVYVLVDLSETWQNKIEAVRNTEALVEVGEGIGIAADGFEPPIAVEYRVIGARSLGRKPICQALYRPSLRPPKRPSIHLVTKLSQLRQVLATDCPATIAKHPPEPLTEISAAVRSTAAEPRGPKASRYFVILSDFREEASHGGSLAGADLRGTRVLMIYRVLPEDESDQDAVMARVGLWKRLLQERGAEVVDPWPDANVQRARVANFLAPR